MKLISKLIVAVVAITAILALSYEASASDACREESLVKFVSGGKEVPSTLIGTGDACDNFGGNEAFSPKHGLRIFVNFNIAVTVDLDVIDAAFEAKAPSDPDLRERLAAISLAVVDNDWIKKNHHTDSEVSLNMTATILFLSEKAIDEGRLGMWLEQLYSIR